MMYTIKNAFKNKGFAKVLSAFFAIFTVMASFGVGNLSQANSISDSVSKTFSVPTWVTGIVLAIFTFVIVFGGIKSISKVTSVLVPVMAVFYIVSGIVVIIANIKNVPSGVAAIFSMAFGGKAVAGGVMGAMTASMMNSMKFGFARGVFSNEAGLGSAAISASSVATDNHVKQGYINMCGTLIDTFFVCTITGLVIASSGLLGTKDESGEYITGAKLTLSAFESILGKPGIIVVTIGIILFAWSTILGWEYQGEKALEFLFKKPAVCHFYRVFFAVMVYFGATLSLDIVWSFSDIANGLMAIPNLISLLILSGILAKDTLDYEKKKRNNLL